MRKAVLALASAVLVLGTATGCSSWNDSRGLGDAPAKKGDDSAADITNMPDKYPNIAVKCIKGHEPWAAVVTTDRITIMIQDPANCGGQRVPGSLMAEANGT